MERYQKYLNLKSKFRYKYRGVKMDGVMSLKLWDYANFPELTDFSWRSNIKVFMAYQMTDIVFDKKKNTILTLFGAYNRKDHLALYNNVLNKLDGKASHNEVLKLGKKFALHPTMLIELFKYIRSNLSDMLSLRTQWKLFVNTAFYCNTLHEIEKIELDGIKKFMCQCSVLDIEHMMTQYMQLHHIPTYSLEEGLYYIFKKNIPVDFIQYENFITDYLLSWGQYSVDEDASYGIPKERLLVAGYPKNVSLSTLKENNEYKKCMILLARDSMRQSNMRLLDLLSDFTSEYHFCIKLHPNSDHSFYSQYAKEHSMDIVSKELTVNDCLDKEVFDFAIAVNTTAYYEAYMRGLPCLRYLDEFFSLPKGCNDIFQTKKEFSSLMERIRATSMQDYQSEIDSILSYVMGVGIDNYKKILCDDKEDTL